MCDVQFFGNLIFNKSTYTSIFLMHWGVLIIQRGYGQSKPKTTWWWQKVSHRFISCVVIPVFTKVTCSQELFSFSFIITLSNERHAFLGFVTCNLFVPLALWVELIRLEPRTPPWKPRGTTKWAKEPFQILASRPKAEFKEYLGLITNTKIVQH